MLIASSKIWARVAEPISYDVNHYAKHASMFQLSFTDLWLV